MVKRISGGELSELGPDKWHIGNIGNRPYSDGKHDSTCIYYTL